MGCTTYTGVAKAEQYTPAPTPQPSVFRFDNHPHTIARQATSIQQGKGGGYDVTF